MPSDSMIERLERHRHSILLDLLRTHLCIIAVDVLAMGPLAEIAVFF
jgi:hypothetical protein